MNIGITGPARHGKDTLGGFLSELSGLPTFAYATPLKQFIHMSFFASLSPEEAKEGHQTFTTTGETIATGILVALGKVTRTYGNKDYVQSLMDVLKANHDDFHVSDTGIITFTSSWRKLYQIIGTDWGRECISERVWIDPFLPEDDVIVTDVRRVNEAQAIKDLGGIIVKVMDPRKSAEARDHVSEEGLPFDMVDKLILNNGTLEDLRDAAEALLC